MNARALIISTLGLVCCGGALAQASLPQDVAKFAERRDACDHFRGEEPYDEARRRFLAANLARYCKGTDKELARLKAKYRGSREVMATLDRYEPSIEAGDE